MHATSRKPQNANKRNPTSSTETPQFSQEFMREVSACSNVEEFREVLSRRNLWVNRNAAEGVFRYLKQSLNGQLTNEELLHVTGGISSASTVPYNHDWINVQNILSELSRQIAEG